MHSYEQAMESLRISDPDLHQKLTAALNQITDLPVGIVQQLADSLESITETSDYREKLVSGLNDIRQAAEDPWEAFEKEESWVTQQLCGVKGHAVEALNDIAIILQEQVHNVRASLGQYGATISDSAFLITCFFLAAYFHIEDIHLPTSGFSKLSLQDVCLLHSSCYSLAYMPRNQRASNYSHVSSGVFGITHWKATGLGSTFSILARTERAIGDEPGLAGDVGLHTWVSA